MGVERGQILRRLESTVEVDPVCIDHHPAFGFMNAPWTTDEMPAVDVIVMMRLDSVQFPVWPGHCCPEGWRSAGGPNMQGLQVLGWMTMDNAAKLLDGPRKRRR